MMYNCCERLKEMNANNSEEMIQAPFKINEELDQIIPKLVKEKFEALKADIKSNGLKNPIAVMVDKTIIDGHNRYRALKDIGKKDYEIDFVVISAVRNIQEAKEYSIEINFFRRQMEVYQAATWALGVWGKLCTNEEIAKKVGLSRQTVDKVKRVNQIMLLIASAEKASELKKGLDLGTIGFFDALGQLTTAENIDNIIACVADRVTPKIGKDKAKAFKMKLETEYFTKKYDKKALKEINTEIDKVEHPELYEERADDKYVDAIQPVVEKINTLADKFPLDITVKNVTSEAGFTRAEEYLHEQAGTGKLFAMVVLFRLPERLVPDAN